MDKFNWLSQFSQPSKLDTFAMYLTNSYWGRKDEDGNDIEFTDELFIAELLKQFEKTPEMKAGTALHKILELANEGTDISTIPCIELNNEVFNFCYTIQDNAELHIPQLREQKILKTYNGITINGVVDALNGNTVYDHKLTKQINYSKYQNSYQWKIYLWMLNMNYFTYNVFQAKVKNDNNIYTVEINKFSSFNFENYPSMFSEIEDFYSYYWEVLINLKPLLIETAHKNNIILKGK